MSVCLALDDFGIGDPQLVCLRLNPFDKIKVDRSIVLKLMTRRDKQVFYWRSATWPEGSACP